MFKQFITSIQTEYKEIHRHISDRSSAIQQYCNDLGKLLNQSVEQLAIAFSKAILSGQVPLYCDQYEQKCKLYCGENADIVQYSISYRNDEIFTVYINKNNVSQLVSKSFITNYDRQDVKGIWYLRWSHILHHAIYQDVAMSHLITDSLSSGFDIIMYNVIKPVIQDYLKQGKMLEVVEDIFATTQCEYKLCELNAASTLPKMLGLGNLHSDQHLNIDQCLFYLKGLQRQLSVYIPKYVNELITNHYITQKNMLRCRCVFYSPKSGQTSASQTEAKSEDTTLMSRCDI